MTAYRALAPAKVNLGLFLGPRRASDGRHELLSVMQSISLADTVTLEDAPAGAVEDELSCPGVPGGRSQNLAARALAEFRRATGWDRPPLHLQIDKRIPLAGGMAGGSADAAATLRLASHAAGLGEQELLLGIAERLGADVPAQLRPGRWLAGGAGEQLERLPAPRDGLLVLVLPASGLSTAAVYAEADRLGLARSPRALKALRARLLGAFEGEQRCPPRASCWTTTCSPRRSPCTPGWPTRCWRSARPVWSWRCSADPGRRCSGCAPAPARAPAPGSSRRPSGCGRARRSRSCARRWMAPLPAR